MRIRKGFAVWDKFLKNMKSQKKGVWILLYHDIYIKNIDVVVKKGTNP